MKKLIIHQYKNKEVNVDYLVKSKKVRYDRTAKLYRTEVATWAVHARGKCVGVAHDDGNGIDIKTENLKVRLDYSQFFELEMLMTEIRRVSKWEKPRTKRVTCG